MVLSHQGHSSNSTLPLAQPITMGYQARMVTVLRADGLRVVVYTNDHQPAHVHVFSDGEAKVNLFGPGGTPDLVWADRMTQGELRRAMRVIVEHQAAMLQRWENIHGRAD